MRAVHQSLVIDHIERCQRGRTGHSVAAVGPSMRPGPELVEQSPRGEDARQRQPRGDPLGHDHDVRRGISPRGGEETPGAGVSGLHLVDGEQDPVAIGHLAQGGQESVRWDHVAALAQDRLDQDGRDVIGRHQRREQLVDGVHGGGQGRIGPAHAQGIGEGHEVDAAHERLEVRPVLDVGRGERHGAVRAAVESAPERDHGRASRHHFGQLHRGLDRLRAGV